MSHRVATACAWLALVSSGCAAVRPKVPEYRPDRPAAVGTARAGDHLLIRVGDRPGEDWIVTRRELRAGDAVGFARDGDMPVAVAGAERIPLLDGSYRWQAPSPGETWKDRLAYGGWTRQAAENAGAVLLLTTLVVMLGVFVYGVAIPGSVGMNFR